MKILFLFDLKLLQFSLVPIIIFALLFSTVNAQDNDAQVIHVELSDYQFIPDEIQLGIGHSTKLRLVNNDQFTPHNFVLQDPDGEFDIDVNVGAGETKEITLKPQTAGEYTFYCSKRLLFFESHREKGMEGTLVVLPE